VIGITVVHQKFATYSRMFLTKILTEYLDGKPEGKATWTDNITIDREL
jgi:hypothetical protein